MELSQIDKTELEEYQEWVAQTTVVKLPKALMGWWAASILVSEAAEVLELHEKAIRKHDTMIAHTDDIIDELGDTMWTLAAVANAYGVSLDQVIEHNIQKINERIYNDSKQV